MRRARAAVMRRRQHPAESERAYLETIQAPLKEARVIGQADIVVGIPFYDEADTIGQVLATARDGLRDFYPQKTAAVVCVGASAGSQALHVVNQQERGTGPHVIAFLMGKLNSGRGWALKAITELSSALGADLVILEADLTSSEEGGARRGLSPAWLHSLVEPIASEGIDLVTPSFVRHPFDATVTSMIAYPLVSSIYGTRIREPLKGEFGLSNKLAGMYLRETRRSDFAYAAGYGADIMLTTCAAKHEARICQVDLGVRLQRPSSGKRELVFRDTVEVLFDRIVRDHGFWEKLGNVTQFPATFGALKNGAPENAVLHVEELWKRYRRGFDEFCHTIYEKVLPEDIWKRLEALAASGPDDFEFGPGLWIQTVHSFLLAFAFGTQIAREDLLNALVPLYDGRLAGFARQVKGIEKRMDGLEPALADELLRLQARNLIEDQADEFIERKPDLLSKWEKHELASRPYLPDVAHWEFIPGVALVVPQEVNGARAETVYAEILERHRKQFQYFVHERLGVRKGASYSRIAQAVRGFMEELEFWLGNTLLPGDPSTAEGTESMVEAIFRSLPHHEAFTLTPEVTSWLVRQHQPTNLITTLGKAGLNEVQSIMSGNDVLALASTTEGREYMNGIYEWLRESLRPEHLAYAPVKPLVLDHIRFPSLLGTAEPSALSKLTGRVLVMNLHKGRGGDYPKLRYLTMVAKNMVEAERFGEVWRAFAEDRKAFGDKVVNSVEGHWGREPMAAHNVFESQIQQELVARFKTMAQDLQRLGDRESDWALLAERLRLLADCYHLALTFPDGRFISCSAWTWASFSFKGGKGLPSPLSLRVERDWASTEFLREYFIASGGSEEEIDQRILELMAEGKESEDLSSALFGEISKELVLPQFLPPTQPEARKLRRFPKNPVIAPIPEHPWESKYVFNPGAIRLDHKVYIVYRAVGEEMISRLGLAISTDGFHIEERLPYPVFEPQVAEEKRGCEDPRLTVIGERLYMLYTAYGVVPQIGLSSIGVGEFLTRRFDKWKRHGLAFPGFPNKDAFLFPESFEGRYLMYHRIAPSIWLSASREITAPWPREEPRILMGPRVGMAWDGVKIGGGSPPIRTRYGWLMVYHGVDFTRSYRLGVILVARNDPARLLYRSPNPVFEPAAPYEVGEAGKSWVPNVVFSCAALPKEDKHLLEATDDILVYYGAADTVIGVAEGKVSDLIPVRELGSQGGGNLLI